MEYLKDLSQLQFLYLTTTGRKTGLPREIEIWFVHEGGRLYVLAEHFHKAQWVKNIMANPQVAVRLADRELRATGRVLDPERDAQLWNRIQQLARTKYGWGEGLPVELEIREYT
jgi:deazaflavin-dependent oxidoreductase (nitroreductase family)